VTLEEYRTLFMVGGLLLVLVAASPGLSVSFPFPEVERFSELWLLGPGHMAEAYPFNVTAGAVQGPVYVGVANHMRASQFYLVYVKFRNQTQLLPNITTAEPSPLPPLYEFRFVLADGESWEAPVRFVIPDVAFAGNVSSIAEIVINDRRFPVDLSSRWDVEHAGFYYQLFCELWRYDSATQGFQFHDRFVTLWLNMTRV
jgi:hypothetical protein